SSGFRTQGWFVGFASTSEGKDQPALAVLAFLKHSHGSECAAMTNAVFAEYARRIPNDPAERGEREGHAADTPELKDPPDLSGERQRRNPSASAIQHGLTEQSVSISVPSAGLRLVSDCSAYSRLNILPAARFSGPQQLVRVHLVRENVTSSIRLEDYVLGVLRAESSIEDRIEALKAQAIITRTFAIKNAGRHRSAGYDFCTLTHC